MKAIIKSINVQPQTFIIILLAITTFFIHIRLCQYGFDDAYIHFRVARNFLETGAPYYNLGEPVKVSSSTGWIIVLTPVVLFSRLFHLQNALPIIVSILNSVFTLLGMFIYTKTLRRLQRNSTTTLFTETIFQIVYIALMAPSSIGLMETPFAMLLAGAGVYLLQSSNTKGFAILGCAAYIRVELVFVIALGFVLIIAQRKFHVINALKFTILGLSPFVMFDLYFFHTILPQSIIAKSVLYVISSVETMGRIIFTSLPVSLIVKNNLAAFIINIALITGMYYFSGKSATNEWRTYKSAYHYLLIFWSLSIISLYIWKHALMFEWYIPIYMIPLTVTTFASAGTFQKLEIKPITIVLTFFLLVSFVSFGQTTDASINSPSRFSLFESGSRVKAYKKVASVLYREYPNATLLSAEIGGLGYEFRGKILDAAGLASPEVLKYHPLNIPEERERGDLGAIPPNFVDVKQPEIIVSYDEFDVAFLKSQISARYNIVVFPAYFPEDEKYAVKDTIWASKYLHVYIRKDLPLSKKIIGLLNE